MRTVWAAIIGAAALIVRLPLFFVRSEIEPGGDSLGYFTYAEQIGKLEFGGMTRTPGYPAYVWLADQFPGRAEDVAVIGQHLIGIAVAVVALMVAWRLFSPAAGVIAGALTALSPIAVVLENTLLPDYLLGAIAFLGAAALAVAVTSEAENRRMLVLAGLLFALAAYVKPVGQALVFVAPLTFVAMRRDWRYVARGTAIVSGVMVLALAPWILRNALVLEDFGMSDQAGVTLYNRAFEIDRFPVPTDDPLGPLARDLTQEAYATEGLRPSSHVNNGLGARGYSQEALDIQQRLALKAIRRNFFTYSRTSFKQLRIAVNDLDDQPSSARIEVAPGGLKQLSKAGMWVGRWLNMVWFLLSVHVVLALVLLLLPGRRRAAAAAFLAAGFLILLATVLTHGGMWRYSVQVTPMAWVVGSAAVVWAAGALWARLRQERAAGSG